MKKSFIIILLIILNFTRCDSFKNQPFNPEDYLGVVWTSENPDIQFTFDESEIFVGYGIIDINSDEIPILVLFSRANYLTIIDENKYNDNKPSEEYKILDGTVKIKDDKLILKVLHNQIFEEQYKKVTFEQ